VTATPVAALVDRLVDVATPYDLALNLPYVVAVAAVATEVAWLARGRGPARKRVLASAATATAMALGGLAVSVPYTVVFRALWRTVAMVRWEAAARLWEAHPVVGAVAAFVAWDLSGFVYHLIGHRTRIGWAAHQPHHSGTDFDATLGLRQSWVPVHGLVHQPLTALAGFDLRVVFVCAALSSGWQILEHTSLDVRFPGWLAAVVMTPAAHRHHHGRDGGAVNLGPVFTLWDRLAGTWVPAAAPAPTAYGPAGGSSANPLAIELAGWRELVRPARRRPAVPAS
jgi:sterol desaturase/sphingolipid hydroxylase (fatty acid hydroxylase superfamily)